jgi:hypothetical protein
LKFNGIKTVKLQLETGEPVLEFHVRDDSEMLPEIELYYRTHCEFDYSVLDLHPRDDSETLLTELTMVYLIDTSSSGT